MLRGTAEQGKRTMLYAAFSGNVASVRRLAAEGHALDERDLQGA